MTSEDTELTDVKNYNIKNMIFSKPIIGAIPNTPITFQRVMISTKNKNGSIGELVFQTTKLFSYGISENTDPQSNKVNGYSMGICLWDKDDPTKEEKQFTNSFNNVVENVKKWLLKNKDILKLYDLEMNDLKKLNPLYWKKDKGKIVEGVGPVLYAKLLISKKEQKKDKTKPINITTTFYKFPNSQNESELIDNPRILLGKYCHIHAAIKIESIFIGSNGKCSLQVKLYEAEVQTIQRNNKRLLRNNSIVKPLIRRVQQTNLNDDEDDSEDIDDDTSESEEEVKTKSKTKRGTK